MKTTRISYFTMVTACLVAFAGGASARPAVNVGSQDIGGVVTSVKGPEAGVWVIAQTTDLPTKFVKIVVTDDQGRYLIPDLPKAGYKVWVRGYGLVDSPKTRTAPGKIVNLKADLAPNLRAAAQYYPANYWYSLLKLPDQADFPGTGPSGNGISRGIKSQAEYVHMVKTDGCTTCHQLGNKATREIPADLGTFDSPAQAWERRVQSGQAGYMMMGSLSRMGPERTTAMLGDWTTRIKKGALPPTPPRPQGIERNVVITEWDWSDQHGYLHDEISTDKRNPNVNAYGLIYGAPEESHDWLPVLDPVHNTTSRVNVPYRDPNTPGQPKPLKPSPYWGDEPIWDSHTTVHNPMFDAEGRVWITARIRPKDNPAYCKAGSSLESAKLFPLNTSGRQLAVYDPKTKKVTTINTCFGTHHLQFAEDADNTLWTSSGGGGDAVGWLNTKMWDKTHDEEKSQGWTALILDTNGNGKRDAYVEPNQPVDPKKDKRIAGAFYGVTVSPADGSVWGTILGFPGGIARINPGSNPPETALTEYYELPWKNPKARVQGFSPRGLDIDTNGVVWTVLASGHLASFDRRKCKVLNGPTATGQQCPEGWTLYPLPGPQFENVKLSGSADTAYYDWVDQFDTFGLGRNVAIATGSGSDSLLPVVNGKFVVLRIPYPMGFYTKNLDGRIDDPKAGWKGKGLWTTLGSRVPFHMETGKGTLPKVAHLQLRPNPLAN
jgi:hypothetical protein